MELLRGPGGSLAPLCRNLRNLISENVSGDPVCGIWVCYVSRHGGASHSRGGGERGSVCWDSDKSLWRAPHLASEYPPSGDSAKHHIKFQNFSFSVFVSNCSPGSVSGHCAQSPNTSSLFNKFNFSFFETFFLTVYVHRDLCAIFMV